MAFKLVAFTTLLALANAGLAPSYPSPAYQGNYPAQQAYQGNYPAQQAYHGNYPAQQAYPVASYAAPVAKIAAPVYAAPIAKVSAPVYAKAAPEPYDAHPQYNFAYEVNDEHTGDVKSQQETRDGDVVKGYYSFIESDGAKRTVEYTSDPEHGFNAVVRREEGAAHPTGPASAPQGYAKAPVYHKVAAPVAYAAPVAKVAYPGYAAPVAKVAYPGYAAPVAKVAYPAAQVYAAPAKVAYPAAQVYAAPAKAAYPAYHH